MEQRAPAKWIASVRLVRVGVELRVYTDTLCPQVVLSFANLLKYPKQINIKQEPSKAERPQKLTKWTKIYLHQLVVCIRAVPERQQAPAQRRQGVRSE